MKSIYNLAALALAFTLTHAAPAKEPLNDAILVQFCKTQTASSSDCTTPISIYQVGSFDIPAGYGFARNVPTPNASAFTLFKQVKGATVYCEVFVTNAESDVINKAEQSSSGASYTIAPGRTKSVNSGGKTVDCANFGI